MNFKLKIISSFVIILLILGGVVFVFSGNFDDLSKVELVSTAKAAFTCGVDTVLDSDSKTYGTVQIGSQCWLSKNMNKGTLVTLCQNGVTPAPEKSCKDVTVGSVLRDQTGAGIEKYCYDDLESNCFNGGGIYQWAEAMQLPSTCNDTACAVSSPHQGICPTGWHIPTDAEQYTLELYLTDSPNPCRADRSTGASAPADECANAGEKLQVGGTSGFEGFLNGYTTVPSWGDRTDGMFKNLNQIGGFYSATQNGDAEAWHRHLWNLGSTNPSGYKVLRHSGPKYFGDSVRCISDVSLAVPAKVIGLSATPGDAKITLSWTAPANGGSPITNYKVYRSTTSGSETLVTSGGCSSLGNVLVCTDMGLTNGTTYYYQVSAVNGIGEGPKSDEVSATPVASAVPFSANVMGFAWSENIGWINFNSKNCDINDNKIYEGLAEGAPANCPLSGSVSVYGVNLDLDITSPTYNNLSGYAWSENIGWVSFNWNAIKDALPLTECPSGNGSALCQAKLTGSNFSGWARACSVFQAGCAGVLKDDKERGGWDGWIKLRKDSSDSGASPSYGVSLSGNDFIGHAWASDVIGWVCFNNLSANCDLGAAGPNYKVYLAISNTFPTVVIPPGSPYTPNYCVAPGVVGVRFYWKYTDVEDANVQAKYQLIITKDPGPGQVIYNSGIKASPATDVTGVAINADAGKCSPGPNCTNFIEYGSHNYSWTVQAWDSGNLSDGVHVGNNFGPTPSHRYPDVNFSPPPPSSISTTIPIQFCTDNSVDPCTSNLNNSVCYDNGGGVVSCAIYNWNFGDTKTSTDVNPTHSYVVPKPSYSVTLTANDGSYSCSKTKILGVSKPRLREVTPK